MQYSKNNSSKKAFSLVEVMTALAILALISSSVFVVIDRSVRSAADSALRAQAFEIARENMEKLLASFVVNESVEYGESEKYPGITWQTVVETFYEPITARMWVRGVCSAGYLDSEGQTQTVELEHWLTHVTKQQLLEIMARNDEDEQLATQLIGTIEEAAEYAQVDVQTIEQWIEDGLLTTRDGSFIKMNLDIYLRANGSPDPDEKNLQVESETELLKLLAEQDKTERQGQIDPETGLSYEQLDGMGTNEVWELIKNRR